MVGKRRIEWVDVGKYICIMFVMISHLESNTAILKAFYAPFFLTMFFFLSGYVYRQPESFGIHIKKKFAGLFVPWFVFSNLNILLSAIVTLKGNRNIKKELLFNLLQIRNMGDGMWFVAALFVAFIPFYFVMKIKSYSLRMAVFMIFALGGELYRTFFPDDYWPWGSNKLPWHLEYIFFAMFLMALGYYYKRFWEEKTDCYLSIKTRIVIGIIYLALLVLSCVVSYGIIGVILSYVLYFVGIVFAISICKAIKSNKYISFVGSNTLLYFAMHGKAYAVIEKILHTKANNLYTICLNNVFLSSVTAFLIAMLISIILIIPIYFINRFCPWVVGRKR